MTTPQSWRVPRAHAAQFYTRPGESSSSAGASGTGAADQEVSMGQPGDIVRTEDEDETRSVREDPLRPLTFHYDGRDNLVMVTGSLANVYNHITLGVRYRR
ncbi:hypothetical protein GJ744_007219 [Endocarpon pusillum]|uniref:Uncharacterized protein n=1 Tax=Endocarpon pusillum TaxID=364733 RepID=A0A8H7A702_9EURO|nr:hypothetical protein GJ744_007219 [Endocarpon pusillum]